MGKKGRSPFKEFGANAENRFKQTVNIEHQKKGLLVPSKGVIGMVGDVEKRSVNIQKVLPKDKRIKPPF